MSVQIEVLSDGENDAGWNLAKLFDVSEDQGMFTEKVDETWNSSAGAMDGQDGVVGEEGVGSACDEQTLRDVGSGLFRGEGLSAAPQGDALTKLAQAGLPKGELEFWLTGEDDLDKLLGSGFEVGQKADLFEELEREVLGFIDDDDAGFLVTVTLDEPAVELEEHSRFGAVGGSEAEVGEDELEEVEGVEPGVEDEGAIDATLIE